MRIKMWLQDRKTSGIESRENFFRSAGKELAVAAATAQWPTWRSNREPDSFSNLGLESQEQWNLVSTVPVNDPSALLYDLDNDGQQVLVPAKTLRSFQDVRAMPNAAGNCYASWVSLEISQPELSRYALWYRFWGQRDRERDGERGRERNTVPLPLLHRYCARPGGVLSAGLNPSEWRRPSLFLCSSRYLDCKFNSRIKSH